MSNSLTVRMYNIRFGDAILITIPDRDPSSGETIIRRILIDVGNAPKTSKSDGGDDEALKPVVDDIIAQLNGKPLDLYIMTHEHLDHVQGLPHVAWKFHQVNFLDRFKVNHVWLTASAAPDYYNRFPEARKKKLEYDEMRNRIKRHLDACNESERQALEVILAINDSTKTSQCVDFLRKLNTDKTTYIYRGVDLRGRHPFKETEFEVWAPEEDTSDYYSSFQPMALSSKAELVGSDAAVALPPPGVDVGAFMNLVSIRSSGMFENALAIDQAQNNTSIVFALNWREWRLLFSGDAELRSWRTMAVQGVLKPVHFLKVSHHGSHNGTPTGEIFDEILPKTAPDGKPRKAAISTWTDTYNNIPHLATNNRIKSRAKLKSTTDDKNALYFDVLFQG